MADSGQVQSIERVTCPNCGDRINDLVEELLTEEPFNGVIGDCACGHELDLQIAGIVVDDLGKAS